MNETSFIGKIICAVGLAAALGWMIPTSIGGLLEGSAATDLQIFWVKVIFGFGSAFIGGCLGWVHSQLIISGSIFSAIGSLFLGIFSP
ncbi:MAG: hypothetical protein ABJO36_03520 [Litorimonas sp.]